MGLSMYHSATGAQSPHCIHAIGIGKTGAQMVEALIRTGEIEDMLEDSRARFTGLAVDIGDQDLHELREYATASSRLEERGIPTDRAQIRTVALEVPAQEDLMASLNRYREFLKMEYPRYYWNPNYEPWLPGDTELPEAGDSSRARWPRRSTGARTTTSDRPSRRSSRVRREHRRDELPSMVLIFFSLARRHRQRHGRRPRPPHLQRQARPPDPGHRRGRLPFSGDPEYHRGDRPVPDVQRARLHARRRQEPGRHGGLGRPLQEPVHRRLLRAAAGALLAAAGCYTETGEPAIRQALRTGVTRKFVDDSFCRFVVQDYGRELFKALRPAGFTGAPHERNSSGDRNWTLFDVAKFTHPGVEVLPGEP